MPKIVPDVRRAAIESFRRRVEARGWKALEVRSLASSCGVAAGTLYNYFPSREAVAAAAISEDWLEARRRLRAFPAGNSAMENLRLIHGELGDFMRRYRRLWASPTVAPDQAGEGMVAGELRRIRQDLERIAERAIEGHPAAEGIDAAFLPKFTARTLEQWAQDPRTSWRELSGILGRLIASP
jgi:AcrR family transcriptional regulator